MPSIAEKYGTLWTREETILCFYLYCQTPFSKTNRSNRDVVRLANLLCRTVGSVVRKLGNLGAVDERLRAFNIKGLTNYSKLDKEVFDAYIHNWEPLVSMSQIILNGIQEKNDIKHISPIEDTIGDDIMIEFSRLSKLPTERQAIINARIRQTFFRRAVLSNYDNRCCISGLDVPSLLVASHIVPWKEASNSRIDPQNGLLLSELHDKAFDTGLITITPNYRVNVSRKLFKTKSDFLKQTILHYDGKEISHLSKFLPKEEYLRWHNKNKFQK